MTLAEMKRCPIHYFPVNASVLQGVYGAQLGLLGPNCPALNRRDLPLHEQLIRQHIELSSSEASVLELIAAGMSDTEICSTLSIKFEALRSRLRRFSARTGLHGRALVVWSVSHRDCCLENAAIE